MERINKKYAIIYIDREGESLKEEDNDYTTPEMTKDYFSQMKGVVQWNFYLIIPKELVDKKKIKSIESNESYTRKYVIPTNKIDSFVADYFPDLQKERGKFYLGTGETYGKAWANSNKIINKLGEDLVIRGSFLRNHKDLYALKEFDLLRADLIKNPEKTLLFITHNDDEINLLQKKFHPFNKKLLKNK